MKTPIFFRQPRREERRLRVWFAAAASFALGIGCSGPHDPSTDGSLERDAGEDSATGTNEAAAPDAMADRELAHDAKSADQTARDAMPTPRDAEIDIAAECPVRADTGEGCALANDGTLRATPFSGAMIVAAIQAAPLDACRVPNIVEANPPPSAAQRLTLQAADGAQISVVIRASGLPADLFRVGETIDVALDAWEDIAAFYKTLNQTIILSRSGNAVAVAARLNLYGAKLPDLGAAGIQLGDDGIVCSGPQSMSCVAQDHRLRVRYDGHEATMLPGETTRLGDLVFGLTSFQARAGGNCDIKGWTRLAGFWSP